MLIIGKGSVEEKVRREKEERRSIRHQVGVIEGTAKAIGAQRGDYSELRQIDNTLKDYCRFKDLKDREKIKQEYHGREREMRRI